MPDNVILEINDKAFEDFVSYRVESNLFQASDTFSFEISNSEIDITEGDKCVLKVNGKKELVGVIERIEESYDHQSHTITLSGRDIMGQVVNTYIENKFTTLKDMTLQDLAEYLLADVPYVDRCNIIYGEGDKNRIVALQQKESLLGAESEYKQFQITPGQTVFEALRIYALSEGKLFFALPAGTFVFGEPVRDGKALFSLTAKNSGQGNNATKGRRIRDIAERYSKTVIVARSDRDGIFDEIFGSSESQKGEVIDDTFPKSDFYKPFVAFADTRSTDYTNRAKFLVAKQRFNGNQLEYTVQGHSQNGINWQPNAIVHVDDEIMNGKIKGDFLIYARTFEKSKKTGTLTTLRLSTKGVFPA